MKLLPYIFIAVVLIIAGVFVWRHFRSEELKAPPPTAGSVPIVTAPHVTHGDPSLPQPDEHTTGVLHIAIPADSTNPLHPTKPRDIFVYIPDDPEEPPQVRSEIPVQARFAPVVDPWLLLEVRFIAGGSSSTDGVVSPFVGLSGVKLFRKVNIGVGLDRTAAGAFVSYEFFREFNAGAMWYFIPIRDTHARASIFIAYRF